MENITIITDSCANIPLEYLKRNNIITIPMYYRFDCNTYEDNESNIKLFYDNLRSGMKPNTMCSRLDVIKDIFTSELNRGNDIIYICFSSNLSSSYSNSMIILDELKKEYPNRSIYILDSLTGSLGEGLIALEAKKLLDKGKSLNEITSILEKEKNDYQSEFMISDLKYLKMGGRLKSSVAYIGGLLNIKLLVYTDDNGEVSVLGKYRGEKYTLKRLATRVVEFADFNYPIGIISADNSESMNLLKNEINNLKNIKELIMTQLTSSIGSHLGPDSIGVAYKKKK